jgi:hypothetical protein
VLAYPDSLILDDDMPIIYLKYNMKMWSGFVWLSAGTRYINEPSTSTKDVIAVELT